MQRFFHVSNFIISRSIEFCLEFRVTVFKSRVTGVEYRIKLSISCKWLKSNEVFFSDRVYPTLVDSMKLLTTRLCSALVIIH